MNNNSINNFLHLLIILLFQQINLLSDSLRETQVTKINKKVCEYVYGSGSVTKENFCVYRNGYGPCVGDTGSPAILDNTLLGKSAILWEQKTRK